MKTLFLYIQSEDCFDSFFFEMEGDYSHLHGVVINADHEENLTDELLNIIENNKDIVRLDKPTKDWDFFVQCGWAD